MGDIDYPSEVDKKTTSSHNKDWLLIGLATKGKVAVYHKNDGFKQKVAEFWTLKISKPSKFKCKDEWNLY